MSGPTVSSADLDPRRRRALFRAWHRGIREMDLILGRFADAEIAAMSEEDLSAFERLCEAPDPDLFRWTTGEALTPETYDSPVFRRLKGFQGHTGPIHA